jgi:hypothetical protein
VAAAAAIKSLAQELAHARVFLTGRKNTMVAAKSRPLAGQVPMDVFSKRRRNLEHFATAQQSFEAA